ncbi:protein wings apart-like isoform X2 [Plutella xylostella]|uniref:protein wings apart-like isoform X2 n=1 Tax=Plutella xylostella TaxID=51655 RepID=UPI0020325388|nr:protein wings apart-like isoform X2 [Plutella xylostella]
MSRWGRGRGGSVAVPLDSALFRENSNCPTAARSAGTVGKWGITSFTSIRSAPYAYTSAAKKPVQDQNSPLTVPAVETEAPPPKPKKFFKSRNAEALPPVPQITYAPPVVAAPLSPEHPSNSRDKRTKKGKAASAYTRDSCSPEAPRYKGSEKPKARKNSVVTKASKKEEFPDDEAKPPNKRYLVRNRNKVINYAEDGSNSPIPDFTRYESLIPPPPKEPSPQPSPSVSSPTYVKPGVASPSLSTPSTPTSKDGGDDRKPPPIVLRISKGTSRIVSTDSNEGFTSPGSDRHSSMDTHSDYAPELKQSPSMESISSPKHEGLKITIKCSGLNEANKKEKKKEKKDHKSHKRHHKNSDDEPLKKAASPQPGTDAYELYKTLASPAPETQDKQPVLDEIESQLAELDSTGPSAKSPKLEASTEPLPEPKPPESMSGRARRNRAKINYSENDDYLDAVTSKRLPPKVILPPEPKKEGRKGRHKREAAEGTSTITSPNPSVEPESHIEKNELIDILSGATENEPIKLKISKKQRNKPNSKQSSPHSVVDIPQENISEPPAHDPMPQEDKPVEETPPPPEHYEPPAPRIPDPEPAVAAHNSPEPPDNYAHDFDDEVPKPQEDVFKAPQGVSDTEGQSEDKPSVKLVITKKKGSIFKSKSLMNDSESSPLPARKRRHLYKHEWANDKGNETPRREPEQAESAEGAGNPSTDVPDELTRITRYRAPDPIADMDSSDAVKPYTSVRCAKEAKEYYTVVRNVKKAHQIQEIGEFQEFNDDVEYLLDALQDNNPISTRCLSAITLASKCTAPAFRMHLRAHATVQKFFSALHDATNDQSLGLCTATVMFVLSQDRLNMDLDRESLELMLNLLESDVSHKNALDDCGLTSAQLTKTQERVRELCAEIKSQGKAKDLDLENITVGHLAMETLLSLTSKRAGEWFKEELRVLGGVDHILRTIQDCVCRLRAPAAAWGPADVDVLRKADRSMRVLENVTQQNEENQLYLVSGERTGVVRTLSSLLWLCVEEARGVPATLRGPLLDAALPNIKVLVNLSHAFGLTASLGATVVGEQVAIMEVCLVVLNNQGNFVPEDRNFEFSVCVLLLLINLVQNNIPNTERLLQLRLRVDSDADIMAQRVPALDLIVQLFYTHELRAKQAEENTDALLDGEKDTEDKKKQTQDDIDETVAKLLARAGTHMEHTMVGAYTALLLGHMASLCAPLAAAVRARVRSYSALLPTLNKYYNFLTLTASAEATIVAHVKATQRIIKFMEASDEQDAQASAPAPPAPPAYPPRPAGYYQTSPSDMPQDMSINNLTYNSMNYSSSGSDRMSSSMEMEGYH